MDQVAQEDHFPVTEGRKRLRGAPSRQRLLRWIRVGLEDETGSRFFLEHTKYGKEYHTSVEAFERFMAKCNGEVRDE